MMDSLNLRKVTRRIATILSQRGSPLAKVVEDAGEVRKLPRHVREQIVDALGEEFAAKGLKRDSEPNAYGLELEALTDACGLAWDDSATPLRDQHDARAC
jgi:hypothetical protein